MRQARWRCGAFKRSCTRPDAAGMQNRSSTRALLFVGSLLLTLVPAARAQELVLSPHYQPGDRYALVLETTVETEASARRGDVDPFRERVDTVYRADVEVLDVDAEGSPTRERHEDVRVTRSRGDESASLFVEGARLDVERDARGHLRVRTQDGRRSESIERIVAPLLEARIEHSLGAELVDPARTVDLGERWELSRSLARRLLLESGVRTVRFDGPPTAELRPDASDPSRVSLHYRIPVARCEPTHLPDGTLPSRSRAILEGHVDFASDHLGWPVAHVASLELSMRGTVHEPGVAPSWAWSLDRSDRTVERTRPLARVARANGRADGPVPASLAP